jgi:hypothetical protein
MKAETSNYKLNMGKNINDHASISFNKELKNNTE